MRSDYEAGYQQQRQAMVDHAWTLEHARRALALREAEDPDDDFSRGVQDAIRGLIGELDPSAGNQSP